jgi:hypothetical protein
MIGTAPISEMFRISSRFGFPWAHGRISAGISLPVRRLCLP